MNEQKYLLSYDLIKKKGSPHEGCKNIAFLTLDGRKGIDDIPVTELFQVFAHLAVYLSENCTDYQQQIAKVVLDSVKSIMQNKKGFLDSLSKNIFE